MDAVYETSFDGPLTMVESVSFAMHPDGQCKVIHYSIQPCGEKPAGSPAEPSVATSRTKRALLWFADQILLLFDFTAYVVPYVERDGQRRFNIWPFLLLFCSSIGFLCYGLNLGIELVQQFWHTKPASENLFGFSPQEQSMLIWTVIGAVGRLAALNLGSNNLKGTARGPADQRITAKRLFVVCRRLLLLAALAGLGALIGKLLVAATEATNDPGKIIRMAWMVGIGVAVVVFMKVVWTFIRMFLGVRQKVNETLAGGKKIPANPAKNNSARSVLSLVPILIAAVVLVLVSRNITSQRAAEAQQQARGALQTELGDKLGKLLFNDRRITYDSFKFDYVPDAPRILLHYSGLKDWRSKTNGVPRALRGDLVLNLEPPDFWRVTGAGDLAEINTSFQTAAHGYVWWANAPADSQPVETTKTSKFFAATNLSFGPATMRTIQSVVTGTNLFLNLDTGQLLTPPENIRRLFMEDYATRIDWEWHDDPRALKMGEWLRSSGANLMVSDGGRGSEELEIREAAAIPPHVISNNVVVPFGFDQADANYLATRLQRMLDSLLEHRRSDKTIWTLQPGFDPRLNSRQDSFCFKTAKGAVGILQIVNAENNPAGVRVRYKLVQTNTPAAQTTEPTDLREAKGKLAELKIDYAPDNATVQRQLARVKELERLTREEPDAPPDLREAKAHLAELRVDYAEQNPRVQEALARIKALGGK